MAADNIKHFEFRLGKWGLGLFVSCASLLVFFAFLFGVKVGKDMDAYPERYSWGIPKSAMETLGLSEPAKSAKTVVAVREAGKEPPPNENSEYDLSFYDTLSKKSNNLRKPYSENEGAERLPAPPAAPVGEEAAAVPAAPPVPALTEKKPVPEKKEEKAGPVHHNKLEPALPEQSGKKGIARPVHEKKEAEPSAAEKKADRPIEKSLPAERKIDQKVEKPSVAEKKTDKTQDIREAAKKPDGQRYMIQVGSYQDKAKAEEMSSRLKALGYAPRLIPMELPGKGKWYRLTIGGFASHDKAAEAVANVGKNIGGSRGFIRPEGAGQGGSADAGAKKKTGASSEKKTPEKQKP